MVSCGPYMHCAEPAEGVNMPGLQGRHSPPVEVRTAYCPAGHEEHEDEPTAAYCSVGQALLVHKTAGGGDGSNVHPHPASRLPA
jgi:hypothetical protein